MKRILGFDLQDGTEVEVVFFPNSLRAQVFFLARTGPAPRERDVLGGRKERKVLVASGYWDGDRFVGAKEAGASFSSERALFASVTEALRIEVQP